MFPKASNYDGHGTNQKIFGKTRRPQKYRDRSSTNFYTGQREIGIDLEILKGCVTPRTMASYFCPHGRARSAARQQPSRISQIGASAQPFNALGQRPGDVPEIPAS